MKKIFAILIAVIFASYAAFCAAASSLPSWYVEDEESFVPFHGENLPRVADNKNVFTEEQEEALNAKANAIVEKYGYDVLIFTDENKTTVRNTDYAVNYYRFNGYGIGDDFSGTLFYLITKEDSNTWWYQGFGECKGYFTDGTVYAIDAKVQTALNADGFCAAIDAYLDCLDRLFGKGSMLPDWYPDPVVNPFPDFHGENLPRVVDDADIFTDEQEAELTALINELITKHEKFDFVIFTDVTTYGIDENAMQDGVFAADFYQFNGYGKGDDYSGSVLFIDMNPEDRYWWSAARGESKGYFTETNVNKIDDKIDSYMRSGDYFEAMKVYIETLDKLYTSGNLIDVFDYVMITIFSLIPAAIVGGVKQSSAVRTMKKVNYATQANDYVVNDSFVLRNKEITFLYDTVTKTYIPPSSSSGGSSYSGGYHSSGGGSFSGGGRHF